MHLYFPLAVSRAIVKIESLVTAGRTLTHAAPTLTHILSRKINRESAPSLILESRDGLSLSSRLLAGGRVGHPGAAFFAPAPKRATQKATQRQTERENRQSDKVALECRPLRLRAVLSKGPAPRHTHSGRCVLFLPPWRTDRGGWRKKAPHDSRRTHGHYNLLELHTHR